MTVSSLKKEVRFVPREAKNPDEFRYKVLLAAARLFLEKGYSQSTTRGIAEAAGVNVNTMNQFFGVKENILCELVKYVLESQFNAAKEMIAGKTEDKILYYATETILQLYLAESSEHIRELYAAAYSLPATSHYIQHTITEKLEVIFKEQLPNLETKEFYKLEIATGGIMRGFMTIPCDMWFTMDQKVEAFLQTTLKIYDVPKEKIDEAIRFVKQFDYPVLVQSTIHSMLERLEKREQEEIR